MPYPTAHSMKNPNSYAKFLDEGEKEHKAALKAAGLSDRDKKRHKAALANIDTKRKAFEAREAALEEVRQDEAREARKRLVKK